MVEIKNNSYKKSNERILKDLIIKGTYGVVKPFLIIFLIFFAFIGTIVFLFFYYLFLLFFFLFFFFLLIIWFCYLKNQYYCQCVITNSEIRCFIQTEIPFSIRWSEFDRIELKKELYPFNIKVGPFNIEITKIMKILHFIKEQEIDTLELKPHMICKKRIKEIVLKLKELAKIKHKDFLVIN